MKVTGLEVKVRAGGPRTGLQQRRCTCAACRQNLGFMSCDPQKSTLTLKTIRGRNLGSTAREPD